MDRERLFVCLPRDDVEPTNSSSKRDLRNSVIHLKVTDGYPSQRGAERGAVFAILLTAASMLGYNNYTRHCATSGPSPLRVLAAST